MHCLPVRRNIIVSDSVLDSKKSLVIQQANNRTYAAQIILKELMSDEKLINNSKSWWRNIK